MALFGRGKKETSGGAQSSGMLPLVGRDVYCRVCESLQRFTRCWRRDGMVRQCPCCGLVFENPHELYKRFQPACPRCREPLEQPGFDYGLCDRCGTKYEIVEGAKPGLLPNRQQREEMDKHGKSWSKF